MDLEKLKYPVGKYQPVENASEAQLQEFIERIEAMPANLRRAVAGLNEAQLNTPYRPGGWTVRQLIHHIGDSHLNSLIRFKWALTEDNPTIKTYDQEAWAELPDVANTPLETNLNFLEALHMKWTALLRSLKGDDWKRTFVHPETGRQLSLEWLIGLYAWHSRHHVAHITELRKREGWGGES